MGDLTRGFCEFFYSFLFLMKQSFNSYVFLEIINHRQMI